MRRLCALVLLLTHSAFAQSTQDERLYVPHGAHLHSTRVVGLGGAYTAIAEGASALGSNLAALAHKSPKLTGFWDWDFTASWLSVPVADRQTLDFDNDGAPDGSHDATQYLIGLYSQFGRLGLGAYWRGVANDYCLVVACNTDDEIKLDMGHAVLGGAWAFGYDDVIVGLGIQWTGATFTYRTTERVRYVGAGFEMGVLYRPNLRPFRIGASFQTGHDGPPVREGATPVLDSWAVYSGVVSPPVISLGASFRLGEGAEHYNRHSPATRRRMALDTRIEKMPPEVPIDAPKGRALLSAQLDAILPVERAVAIRSATTPGEPFRSVTRRVKVVPRVGFEHDTVPPRLRLRAGSYLEPSIVEGGRARLHLTGGAEVMIVKIILPWAISLSFDVATRYRHVGLSLGSMQ